MNNFGVQTGTTGGKDLKTQQTTEEEPKLLFLPPSNTVSTSCSSHLLGDTQTNPSLWDVSTDTPEPCFLFLFPSSFLSSPYRKTPNRTDYCNLGTLVQTD